VINKLGEIFKIMSDFDYHILNIKMGKISHEDKTQIFKSTSDELVFIIFM
jgi:hypothetical protein